jgi:hypothetical protein
MFLYSHLALAHLLTTRIQVEDLGDYLFGAVVPDIRYFVNRDREWTHIPIEDVDRLGGLPGEESFETGYKVHLAIDLLCQEREILAALRSRLPRVIANRLHDGWINTIPDVYYMHRHRLKIPMPRRYEFTLTRYLGISPELVESIYEMCKEFFDNPTPRNGLALFERSGLLPTRRTGLIKAVGLALLSVPGVEAMVIEWTRQILVDFELQCFNEVPIMIRDERLIDTTS